MQLEKLIALYGAKALAAHNRAQNEKYPLASTLTGLQAGTFFGKAGSMRRSTKGRTYHNPDGFRKYNDVETTVAVYRA